MNKQQEALKLAFEALKAFHYAMIDAGVLNRQEVLNQGFTAFTAIRKALAEQPEQQTYCDDCGGFDPECPLKQPAQQQEPVAWRTKNATPPGGYVLFQQYPQAVAERGGEIESLYTSPPASKPWVGLTDEEIEQVCVPLGAAMLSFTEVARAIEAKLREKNA